MLVSPMKRRSPSTETVGDRTGAASLGEIDGRLADGSCRGDAPFDGAASLLVGASLFRTSDHSGDSDDGKVEHPAVDIPLIGDDRSTLDCADGAWPPGPFSCPCPWLKALPLSAP